MIKEIRKIKPKRKVDMNDWILFFSLLYLYIRLMFVLKGMMS